jgi:hypothetical protein
MSGPAAVEGVCGNPRRIQFHPLTVDKNLVIRTRFRGFYHGIYLIAHILPLSFFWKDVLGKLHLGDIARWFTNHAWLLKALKDDPLQHDTFYMLPFNKRDPLVPRPRRDGAIPHI